MAAMKNLVHDEEASSRPTNGAPQQSMCSHSRFWKLERRSFQAFRHTSMRRSALAGFSSFTGGRKEGAQGELNGKYQWCSGCRRSPGKMNQGYGKASFLEQPYETAERRIYAFITRLRYRQVVPSSGIVLDLLSVFVFPIRLNNRRRILVLHKYLIRVSGNFSPSPTEMELGSLDLCSKEEHLSW